MPTPAPKGEIFVVDDDELVRQALVATFSRAHYQVTCFLDGCALIAAARARTPACVLLDVFIPGRSGLEILKELEAQDYPAPVFIISGRGDIAMAVEAIRHGALDFLEKPLLDSNIVQRVEKAIEAWGRRRTDSRTDSCLVQFPGREPLTRREREVLVELITGASNKEAARRLQISPRTIEVHRARIMEKLGAGNLADLVRIVLTEGRGPAFAPQRGPDG